MLAELMKKGTIRIFFVFTMTWLLGTASVFGQSGTWTKKANSISGTWSISTKGGKKVLSLKGFKTATAPDLKIFLSPQTSGQVTSRTATKGSVLVSRLKSSKGDQSYALPANLDLSKYKSIIIHCEKYSKLWGASKL